jgi:hypothetical protein
MASLDRFIDRFVMKFFFHEKRSRLEIKKKLRSGFQMVGASLDHFINKSHKKYFIHSKAV